MAHLHKSAWLITWETLGAAHYYAERPKIVTTLPARTPSRFVKTFVAALYASELATLAYEKIAWPLDSKLTENWFLLEDASGFYFGVKPYLYARIVWRIRVVRGAGGKEILKWTEVPRYRSLSDEVGSYLASPPVDREYVLETEANQPAEPTVLAPAESESRARNLSLAARLARRLGYERVSHEFWDEKKVWDVLVVVFMLPTHSEITRVELRLDAVAREFFGRADGWGCLAQK